MVGHAVKSNQPEHAAICTNAHTVYEISVEETKFYKQSKAYQTESRTR